MFLYRKSNGNYINFFCFLNFQEHILTIPSLLILDIDCVYLVPSRDGPRSAPRHPSPPEGAVPADGGRTGQFVAEVSCPAPSVVPDERSFFSGPNAHIFTEFFK